MATLTFNSQVSVQSAKVLTFLAKRPSGFCVEDIANRVCTRQNAVRAALHRLRVRGLVEHDGCRPRTWKLRDEEPKAA